MEADAAKLGHAFHPRASIVGNEGGEFTWATLDEFARPSAGAVWQAGPYEWRIEGLSFEGDTALVRLGGQFAGVWYSDDLSLVWIDDGWRIVHRRSTHTQQVEEQRFRTPVRITRAAWGPRTQQYAARSAVRRAATNAPHAAQGPDACASTSPRRCSPQASATSMPPSARDSARRTRGLPPAGPGARRLGSGEDLPQRRGPRGLMRTSSSGSSTGPDPDSGTAWESATHMRGRRSSCSGRTSASGRTRRQSTLQRHADQSATERIELAARDRGRRRRALIRALARRSG